MAPLINQTYERLEYRWISEYLGARYPGVRITYEAKLTVPLAPVFNAATGGITATTNRRIIGKLDALVYLPDHFEAWEAKQWANFGGVSQLAQYQEVMSTTWERANKYTLPITYHLLASHLKPEVRAAAIARGFEYVVYLPAWLAAAQQASVDKGIARREAFLNKLAAEGKPIV